MIIIEYITDSNKTKKNISEMYNEEYFGFFIAIEFILTLEGLIFSILLGYLIGLHIYLNIKGITTYEYIQSKRSDIKITPKSKGLNVSTVINNAAPHLTEEKERNASRRDIPLEDFI